MNLKKSGILKSSSFGLIKEFNENIHFSNFINFMLCLSSMY